MKLRNSTGWSDAFIRRMVSWVAGELKYEPSKITEVQARNRSSRSYSGRAWPSRRILVSVGPDHRFPTGVDDRPGMANTVLADRVEALVLLTAHEIQHLCQFRDRRSYQLSRDRTTEHDARWHSVQVLATFREQREALLEAWGKEIKPRAVKPKPSRSERNEIAARKAVETWTRKLKLAQTKLKKYRSKVRYYERKAAAAKPPVN